MLLETGIGLGLKGLSTLLGSKSDKKQARLQQQSMQQAQGQFNQQMDHSVRRRMEDAKRAGIHPLFAMGASVGASPTIQAGNAPVGRGAERGLAGLGEALGLVGVNRAQAQRDEAEAALANAQAAQIRQDMMSQGRDLPARTFAYGEKPGQGFALGPAEYYKPEVPYSQRPGVRAGTIPGRIEFVDEFGSRHTVPNPDLGLDEVGQIEYLFNLPGRVWKNVQGVRSKNKEIRAMEENLRKLRVQRQNPQKTREARALQARIEAKIRSLYNKFRSYTK